MSLKPRPKPRPTADSTWGRDFQNSLETSWDQDLSIENSKPGYNGEMRIGTDRQLCDVVAFDIELIHLGAVTQGLRQTHQLVVPASQTQR